MKKIRKISENFFFILAKKRKLNIGIFGGGPPTGATASN